MNVIKRLVIKNLKLNKKHSIGTVIGIMLSVALICAVAGMFTSLRQTLIKTEINNFGDFHFYYSYIDDEKLEELKHNRDIESMDVVGKLWCIKKDSLVLEVYSVNSANETGEVVSLAKGRFPENENEIAFDGLTLSELGVKLGDKVTLDLGGIKYNVNYYEGAMKITNPRTCEFTIVGELEPRYYYRGYTVGLDAGDSKNAYIRFKKSKEYKENIVNILGHSVEEENVSNETNGNILDECYVHTELLRWENMEFSDDTMRALYSVVTVLIVIIFITSVFCIKNSFDISITEKMQTYGMLASVGSTKKQIRKSVFYEGMYLGCAGIPLGVGLGELAVFILCRIVTVLARQIIGEGSDFKMIFYTPVLPIVLSILLGVVTIYFSGFFVAFKAGRVSPIVNIRSNNEIKIKNSKLKTPGFISGLFGIGGVIAYKNLKRSRRKYRTTIVSIAVSVFVFIAMSSFVTEMYRQMVGIYTAFDYNVIAEVSVDEFDNGFELSGSVKDKVKDLFYVHDYNSTIEIDNIEKIRVYDDCYDDYHNPEICYYPFFICIMEEETFHRYLKKTGADIADDECIVIDYFNYRSTDSKKIKKVRRTEYKAGDVIEGHTIIYAYDQNTGTAEEKNMDYSFKVGAITDKPPYGFENNTYETPMLIVNRKYYNDLADGSVKILIDTDNPSEIMTELLNMDEVDDVENIDDVVEENRAKILLFGIFMYGFITVITLIGITNIFNTITSNMELRQKEFAMLKSIGMTKKEFGRMVRLETLFYSFKALVFGIIAGILGSRFFYYAFAERVEDVYIFPVKPIMISIIFVFVLVYIIMRYSISKVNRQNTIETIRRDNI